MIEKNNYKYSIIIPVFNSENTLEELYNELKDVLQSYNYEIIFINDGSKDNSWKLLKNLSDKDENVITINFLKNYGQHNAVYCGLKNSKGDYVITLDDDLQNPPSEIEKLIGKANEGYDTVFGKYKTSKHCFTRKIGSKIISYLNTKIFDKPKSITVSNFRILKRDVVNRMIEHKTSYPYIQGLALMYSGKVGNISVNHKKRKEGRSNYNIFKIINLVSVILFNYSSYPIKFLSITGFSISAISFILGLVFIIKNFFIGVKVPGWTSTFVLLSFLGGFIILMLGVLGEYISRMTKEITSRKSYHITEINNGEGKE